MNTDYGQWASVKPLVSLDEYKWAPSEDRARLAAYAKYDELYWNENSQYLLRVLEGEEPLYIPNARVIVDTTAHFVMKGLEIVSDGPEQEQVLLQEFLEREVFYTRFHTAKHSGIVRGDFFLHLTANPNKAAGTRISLNSVDPTYVFPEYDPDIPEKMVGCRIAYPHYEDEEPDTMLVRMLRYKLHEDGEVRRVSREEGIYYLEPEWYGPEARLYREILKFGFLDSRITSIPVYHFKNIAWDGLDYGSSELRGFETSLQTISQGSTDISGALALEGLGVYATDGGRPVDDQGREVDWEVAPGRVMEVPQGSYFRRVEGIKSITPAKDQIEYLEDKLNSAASLSDVALGTVDSQAAQSGIALEIRFLPTLAKVDQRDLSGVGRLKQLFFDWKIWYEVFEHFVFRGNIIPTLGEKLPKDRKTVLNELNNMLDRRVISTRYYREKLTELGYVFPDSIEDDIVADIERTTIAAQIASQLAHRDDGPPGSDTLAKENQSNNRNRVNESDGTEADSDEMSEEVERDA